MPPTPSLKTPSEWATLRGWILYDGRCGMCTQSAGRWRQTLLTRGFVLVSSVDDEARRRASGLPAEGLNELRLVCVDGRTFGGAAALGEIARHLRWGRPFAWLAQSAWTAPVAGWLYRRVADHRHTLSGWLGYSPCTDACAVRRG